MKKYDFQFVELDSDHSFDMISKILGAKSINGTIHIPPSAGSGIIKKIKFEEGLYMRLWDFKLGKPFVFEQTPNPVKPKEKSFRVAFVLNPDTFIFKRKDVIKKLKLPSGMNILFMSDDGGIDFEIPAEYHFRAIDISITYSWLIEAFKDESETFTSFLTALNEKTEPTFFLESSIAAEYRTITDLYSTGLSGAKGLLHVKADVLSLLSDFFHKIFNRSPYTILKNRLLDYEKMLTVEKILEDHIEQTLPGIETIAQQLAMSESTLKRHFKLMYGKNLYEYYLGLKMEFAKRMLLEKPLTVNELAAMLDYDNVSNFIYMFKKHYGFSPGSLRKNSA